MGGISSKEQRRVYSHRYWLKHREHLIKLHRKWREANPGWYTAYSQRCAIRKLEQAKQRRQRDPLKYRLKYLAGKYSISSEKYQAMLDAQNGACKICHAPNVAERGKYLRVDHNHATDAVRGLLCQKCNSLLGMADESCERLTAAIAYLREYSDATY